MIKSIKKLNGVLTKRQKKILFFLSVLLFFGMILEMFSLGVILPIFSFIGGDENSLFSNFFNTFYLTRNLEKKEGLIFSSLLILGVYILKTTYLIYLGYRQNRFLSHLNSSISSRLFKQYILMPYRGHVKDNTSNLIKNILVEVNTFNSFNQSFLTFVTECFLSLTIVITLVVIEPLGAIIIASFFSISGIIFYTLTKKKINKWGEQRQEIEGKLSKIVLETFGSIKELKLHKRELFFISKFDNQINNKALINTKNDTLGIVPKNFLELITVIGMIGFVILGVISNKPIQELITTLGIFVVGSFKVIPSINKILFCLQKMKFSSPSVEIVYSELKKAYDQLRNQKNFGFSNEIKIENLSYSFEDKLVLKESNLTINKGQTIGIIGKSGSGKSTFINILSGLLDNYHGQVLVDGKNLKEVTDSWQRSIGYVPQDVYLLDDSILNNIAFGIEKDKIDLNKINKILKITQLFDFVNNLEKGLFTRTGEKGTMLSGGQKQRIGIARALYKDPEVIFLDESTSALDSETEKSLINSLSKLDNKKTFIIISHNSNSLSSCDAIYKISNKNFLKIK